MTRTVQSATTELPWKKRGKPMYRNDISGWHLSLLAMVALTIHEGGSRALADTPSNAILIAAMPPGVESVMVQSVSTFRGEDSIFRDEFGQAGPTRSKDKDFKTVVTGATNLASIIKYAWGGSDFQVPPDTGMTGNFNERAIYIVERTVAELREQLETGRDVKGLDQRFDVAGVKVFKGTIDDMSAWGQTNNSAGEAWFVAIPDDHTVVSAESRSDIEHMLKSLKERRSEIPRKWRGIAAGHNLESPLVILRQYPMPKRNREPGTRFFGPPPSTGATHFALILPQAKSALTKISVQAKNIEKAINWYKSEFLSESDYVWKVKRNDAGATGTLSPKRGGEKPEFMTLSWILLFGPCIMI